MSDVMEHIRSLYKTYEVLLSSAYDDRHEYERALRGVYDMLPRYSCKSLAPDGCAVCVARVLLLRCET